MGSQNSWNVIGARTRTGPGAWTGVWAVVWTGSVFVSVIVSVNNAQINL